MFPVGPYPQVAHLKIKELLAEKVRAILTRTRGRDIFDLYFLLVLLLIYNLHLFLLFLNSFYLFLVYILVRLYLFRIIALN